MNVRVVASRRCMVALVAAMAVGGAVRTAFASGTCVDACVGAFGISFYNSRGDYFLLKDCATSDMTGTTYCTYSRLPAR
jgi:hypothetical protein